MPQSDVFALKNSSLNAFLFADVGIEANGSGLTILSVLARLGKDPWAEAALWAKQPPTAAINSLAASIGRMPLSQAALQNARATAARLVELLPKPSLPYRRSAGPRGGALARLNARYMVFIYLGLCLALNLGMAFATKPNMTAPQPRPTAHSAIAYSPAESSTGYRP